MKGIISFNTRNYAIEFCKSMSSQGIMAPNFIPSNRDGNCTFSISEFVEDATFQIIIIIDNLENRSDEYIKGLLAHEFSEMSHPWRLTRKESPKLKKLKPKARQIFLNQLTKQNAEPGSQEHRQREINVNNEAKRLGFEIEIEALEFESGY